jgi:hypothetical protein
MKDPKKKIESWTPNKALSNSLIFTNTEKNTEEQIFLKTSFESIKPEDTNTYTMETGEARLLATAAALGVRGCDL